MRTDEKKVSIGIIGKGFVGTAVAHGFSHQTGYGADIRIYDSNPEKSFKNIAQSLAPSVALHSFSTAIMKSNMSLSTTFFAKWQLDKINFSNTLYFLHN